ncbi:MAG: 16S rRNA (uracil(1498)-N(3))-methyltransferase [Bacteroidia bacterium]|nr:16S rRNA (uracil(1498)-N(3))-methyltransferase [Bacteroidia bacterium]
MHLFYTPDITTNTYTLSEEESKHCVRVLRMTNGDLVELMDGKGSIYKAEIIDNNPKRCMVTITDTLKVERRTFQLHIAISPTKNIDRIEWFLEKATEIGIDEISFLNCDNSERTVIKNERLSKVIISAIKQSKNAYLPILNELISFKTFIAQTKNYQGQKFIAHCYSNELPHLKNKYTINNNALILIGPEGDFSKEEVQLAEVNGFIAISLGKNRLRTETAALYACNTVNLMNE